MGERVGLRTRTKWALGKGGWQALNVSRRRSWDCKREWLKEEAGEKEN